MAKKKNSKLVPIFSLIIIIAGLVVAAFLIRRPQNFKPQAAVSDPLAGVSAVASGSSCQCTGSTSACANFATQNKCTANKKCQWACPAQATVTSPNGGEVWQRGKTYRITWNQTQAAGSTGLFLYTRGTGGDTYLGAIAYYVSNKEGANYYDWTIGACAAASSADAPARTQRHTANANPANPIVIACLCGKARGDLSLILTLVVVSDCFSGPPFWVSARPSLRFPGQGHSAAWLQPNMPRCDLGPALART